MRVAVFGVNHWGEQSLLLALQVAIPVVPAKPRADFLCYLQALQEFKEIWKQEFGEEISDDLAIEEGINLLTFFNAIYRPIKEEWVKDYDNK